MPKPPRPSASEVLRHNLLILVGLPSLHIPMILSTMGEMTAEFARSFYTIGSRYDRYEIIHKKSTLY